MRGEEACFQHLATIRFRIVCAYRSEQEGGVWRTGNDFLKRCHSDDQRKLDPQFFAHLASDRGFWLFVFCKTSAR